MLTIIIFFVLTFAAPLGAHAAHLPDATVFTKGAQIEVNFEEGDLSVPRAAILEWISESACAVTEYYGHFPVPHLRVVVVPLDHGKGVVFGRAFIPGPVPVIRVMIGRVTSQTDLVADWIMTHEMVHLAFPSVPQEHHWIEEGIATYVEPIARAQVGDLTSAKVWRDMVDGMPHGLPATGDRGLDNTHTWGRTYWGGALFCLLADVEIHQRTHNRFGLQDALRAISSTGSMLDDWPLKRALTTGDNAVGVPALTELYDKMKTTPFDPNLPRLWQDLGVKVAGNSVTFDSKAPLAAVVASIMKPRSARSICGRVNRGFSLPRAVNP